MARREPTTRTRKEAGLEGPPLQVRLSRLRKTTRSLTSCRSWCTCSTSRCGSSAIRTSSTAARLPGSESRRIRRFVGFATAPPRRTGAVRLRLRRFAQVHAGVELRFGREELRRHPPEDVVDDRLREPHLGVLGHPRRLEARVAELVHEHLQRHAVLQRVGNRLREGVGKARNRRAFLGHRQEDLARRPVVEEPDGDVALVAGDVELVRDRVALVRQLPPRRAFDDLDNFLHDLVGR